MFTKKRPTGEAFFGDFEPLSTSRTLQAASHQLPAQLPFYQSVEEALRAPTASNAARPLLHAKDRFAEVEAGVRQAVRGVLGTDISAQAPLVQSGLDSLGKI